MANISNFLTQVRQRAIAAVACGQSPLTGALITGHTNKSLESANLFLIAYCGLPESEAGREVYYGWIGPKGLVAMARHYFDNHPDWASVDTDMREALLYGALTALWTLPPSTAFTKPEVVAARVKIIKKLLATPPSVATVQHALDAWVRVMRLKSSASMHASGAHMFPLSLSAGYTEALQQLMDTVCHTNNDSEVELPGLSPEMELAVKRYLTGSALTDAWSRLDQVDLLCFFSVLSSFSEDAVIDQTRAMFTQIATAAKTSYTDAWLESRWANLVTDSPNMADAERVSRETLIHYGNLFHGVNVPPKTKIMGLVFNHYLASAANFQGIVRMIEQSKAPHVGGLTALCELVMKYSSATFTTLSHTFGLGQTRSIVRLAAMIIHDPYCTISGPPATVSMYADIAYIATELMYNTNRRPGTTRYQSPSTNFTRKPVVFLKQYIQTMIQTETAHAQTMGGPSPILGAYGFEAVRDDVTSAFTITRAVEGRIGAPDANGQQLDDLREYPLTIPQDNITSFIISCRNSKDKAFSLLMEELKDAIKQTPLPPAVINAQGEWEHPTLLTKPLPPAIKKSASPIRK